MRVFSARLGRGIQKHRGTGGGGFEGLRRFESVLEDAKHWHGLCLAQNRAAVCVPCQALKFAQDLEEAGAKNLVPEVKAVATM